MVAVSFSVARRVGRVVAAGLLLLCAGAVTAGDALAQSAQCRSLQAEYAAAQRGGGSGSAKARQFADAARRQKTEIRRAEGMLRQNNCSRSPSARCSSLSSTLERMRTNLAKLERETARLSGGASRGQLARIRARMDAACNAGIPKREVVARRDTGIRQPVERQPEKPLVSGRSGMTILPGGAGVAVAPAGGNLRTVCVRTCDGYFFPVSFGAGKGAFERDAAVCAALCPSAETVLFTQRIDDEEIANMTSVDGLPYSQLPNAFVYQENGRNPACTCGRADPTAIGVAGIEETAARTVEDPAKPGEVLPLPATRPDLMADPETAANTAGGLTPKVAAEIAGSVSVGEVYDVADGNRKVRVVGGEFLPDPKSAIDLRSPAPTSAR